MRFYTFLRFCLIQRAFWRIMEYGIFITERMQPMASKSKSIIGGMTVLGIAGIICKLVGVLFSIPLTYVIGAQGQGIYNAVFPTYNLLLTISSAGLPVAVSRMVSSALAKDDPHSAKHVFRVALLLLVAKSLAIRRITDYHSIFVRSLNVLKIAHLKIWTPQMGINTNRLKRTAGSHAGILSI